MARSKAKVPALRVRPGARYACFGDGLCCTDVHGLGPVSKRETRSLALVSDEIVIPADDSVFDEPMLRTRSDGGCLFLGVGRCDLHAALGADAKPLTCTRFPFGLSVTPTGSRVTTSHRCPCRTLGERPELVPAAAESALCDRLGQLDADRRVPSTLRLARRARVEFAEYETLEADLLARLDAGEDPADVLALEPFPALKGTTWRAEAREMLADGVDDTRFGIALAWFAEAVRALTGKSDEPPELTWTDAFNRAEARATSPGDADAIVADWVADEILVARLDRLRRHLRRRPPRDRHAARHRPPRPRRARAPRPPPRPRRRRSRLHRRRRRRQRMVGRRRRADPRLTRRVVRGSYGLGHGPGFGIGGGHPLPPGEPEGREPLSTVPRVSRVANNLRSAVAVAPPSRAREREASDGGRSPRN